MNRQEKSINLGRLQIVFEINCDLGDAKGLHKIIDCFEKLMIDYMSDPLMLVQLTHERDRAKSAIELIQG